MECKLSNTLSVIHYVCIGRYFRTEDSKENVIVKQVGNVTADSELTFDYGVRRTETTPPAPAERPTDGGDDVKSKGILMFVWYCDSTLP